MQRISLLSLVVSDYDEAIAFYTKKLGFTLVEDTVLSPEKRWVRVAPPGSDGCGLLLAKAATDLQRSRVGDQTGGRVFLFLETDDIARDLARLKDNEVRIVRGPSVESYGTVAVFSDHFGNLWDLIEPKK